MSYTCEIFIQHILKTKHFNADFGGQFIVLFRNGAI